MQKNKAGFLLYTIYKINSKWVRDLNIRAKTIKHGTKHWSKSS